VNSTTVKDGQIGENQSFEMQRLTRSKETVDICPNTIRSYATQGLRLYRVGKAVFFSKTELEQFIRTKGSLRTMPGDSFRSLPQC
jgi:hypothetical protein